MDFIEKDYHRVQARYGTSKEDYLLLTDKFLMKFPCFEGMPYEEVKRNLIQINEEFREATLDYQI